MKDRNIQVLKTMIEHNVASGFVRGQELFVESFEEDLDKNSVIEQVQLEGVLDYLLQDFSKNN